MNIPDEAVEAAMGAWSEGEIYPNCICGSLDPDNHSSRLSGCDDKMRLALTAALPHLDAHIHCAIDAADAHARIAELEAEHHAMRIAILATGGTAPPSRRSHE